MIDIKINQDLYLLPQNWNEISPEQLLMLADMPDNIPANEFKLKLMLKWLGLDVIKKIHSIESTFLLQGVNRYHISSLDLAIMSDKLSFLFKATTTGLVISSNLFMQPFPRLHIAGEEFRGAANGLGDIIYDQWIALETCNGDLDKIFFTLFLKEKYSDESVESAIKKYSGKVDQKYKTVASLFYQGCKNYLKNKFPLVFQVGEGTAPTDLLFSEMELVAALADGDPTKQDKIRQTLLYDVLFALNHLKKKR